MSTPTRVTRRPQAPPRASAPAPTPPPLTPVRPARRRPFARTFEGTPGRLRLLALTSVVVCLAFAVLGGLAFAQRRAALADASAEAAQLVRVQKISIDLARADERATNAFLAQGTGLPPQAVVQQYEAAVSEAARLISDASRAQPADGPALAAVNDLLAVYTARVASAWAVKRDPNTPTLATGYLGLASQTALREGMLPALGAVVTADSRRVDGAYADADADRAGLLLLLTGLLAVLALLLVGFRLALMTRRRINVPLLAGTALVAVFTILGALVLAAVQARSREVRATSYAATRALADARVLGYRAKADESITLIRQNFTLTSTGYQDPAQVSISGVDKQVAAVRRAGVALVPADPLADWKKAHAAVIEDVDAGRTDQAQAVAIGTGRGTSNAAFAIFDRTTSAALASQSGELGSALTSSGWFLLVLALLAVAVGLAGAAAAWLGLSQRIEEYR